MSIWTTERGTLWVLELGQELPPLCSARVAVSFSEATAGDFKALATAMAVPTPAPIQQRLAGNQQGQRRCFILKTAADTIATYGWVTRGVECVGELERRFNLQTDEAYIWDCYTVSAQRGQRFYSTLLSRLVYQLQAEGISRIWIGASRQNEPSIQGIVNAGFQPVLDCLYGRFARLTLLWIQHTTGVTPSLITAAYRILQNTHEQRLGPFLIGFKT